MLMRYEHTPRPEVEHHFHIRDLIEQQEKKAKDRTYHREFADAKEERRKVMEDSLEYTTMDFWCNDCREDFKANAVREIEQDWTNPRQFIGFYKTKHWCGKWCLRHITDKNRDAYWFKSKAVRVDRAKGHNDLIQPFESGYNLLYGKPK